MKKSVNCLVRSYVIKSKDHNSVVISVSAVEYYAEYYTMVNHFSEIFYKQKFLVCINRTVPCVRQCCLSVLRISFIGYLQ